MNEQTVSGRDKLIAMADEIEKVIVGKRQQIIFLMTALLSGGHVLIEDVPGTGKTTLAAALATVCGLSFKRAQFTPDVMASDITGFNMYNRQKEQFEFIEGLAMCNILLADEINRASPKTQSALLEVMQEHKVTIDGKEQLVPEPFMVIGTQNPAEMAGTYPLPESQLDRFMIRLSVGYPDPKASEDMAKRFLAGQLHDATHPVLTARDVREMQSEVSKTSIHDDLTAYAVSIVDATRNKAEISCGASPRALLSMLRCSQALAFMDDRSYCIPEDIASAAALTLPHRLVLSSGARLSRVTGEDMIVKILAQTKVPR